MIGVRSSLVQRAVQQNQPLRKESQPQKHTNTLTMDKSSVTIWFEVCLRDEQEQDVESMITGHTYNINIKAHIATHAHAHSVKLDCTQAIMLYPHYAIEETDPVTAASLLTQLDLSSQKYSLTPDKIEEFTITSTIRLRKQIPTCQLSIHLLTSNAGLLELRKIAIHGKPTTGAEHLQITQPLDTQLPENTAILMIHKHPQRRNKNAFQMEITHCEKKILHGESNASTIVDVAKLMRHREIPRDILGKIREFSEDYTLLNLMEKLRLFARFYEQDFHLIIIDNTHLGIPWEMLEIEPKRYLGAQFQIVRWLPARYAAQNQMNILKTEQDETTLTRKRSVLAYVDERFGETQFSAELTILHTFLLTCYKTLRELEARLNFPLGNVGLIYIGCHGENGKTLQEQGQDQLTSARLNMLDPMDGPRPVVFINACESARIIRDDEWDHSSFVKGFLQHLASGYIGTLGKVGIREASEIAQQILQATTTEADELCGQPLSISETLRRLRTQAANNYFNHKQNQMLWESDQSGWMQQLAAYELKFIYTFLYVYYGSPFERLRISPKEGAGQ